MQRWFSGWCSPSALVLLATNLFPVFGVLVWDWSAFPLLAIYWCETVIVGAISLLKIVFFQPLNWGYWFLKFFCLPFLSLILLPYFFVVLTFYVLIVAVSADDVRQAMVSLMFFMHQGQGDLIPVEQALAVLRRTLGDESLVSAAALAGSHVFSFLWNFLGRGECYRIRVRDLLLQPFLRVWAMLTVLIVGMFTLSQVGVVPAALLLLLVGTKTVFDLIAHLAEHRRLAAAASSSQ